MSIRALQNMPPVKKCIASHGCGHIYETLKDRCPKCDAEEFELGFINKRGVFFTSEQKRKAISILENEIKRKKKHEQEIKGQEYRERVRDEMEKKHQQELAKIRKEGSKDFWKAWFLMVVISMLITVPLTGGEFWICLVCSCIFWLVLFVVADNYNGTSSSSNSNMYKTMAVYQRQQQQKELNELNEQVEDVSDRMGGFY